jgi:hypothetical protein
MKQNREQTKSQILLRNYQNKNDSPWKPPKLSANQGGRRRIFSTKIWAPAVLRLLLPCIWLRSALPRRLDLCFVWLSWVAAAADEGAGRGRACTGGPNLRLSYLVVVVPRLEVVGPVEYTARTRRPHASEGQPILPRPLQHLTGRPISRASHLPDVRGTPRASKIVVKQELRQAAVGDRRGIQVPGTPLRSFCGSYRSMFKI